jgi:predicted transcriptional regulator
MVLSIVKRAFEEAIMSTVKEASRSIVDNLPEQAIWDDLMYELYVKQKIAAGLEAAADGRTVPHEEVKARLLVLRSQCGLSGRSRSLQD